jgi:hypothetical protein
MVTSDLMNDPQVHQVPGDPTSPSSPTPSTSSEWIRVKEALTRYPLSRGQLYRLINSGAIRSASLRLPGQTRATRLICPASLAAFIESRVEGKGGAA